MGGIAAALATLLGATQKAGTANWLRAVWVGGPTDVWAVGAFVPAVHWNGTAWSEAVAGTASTLFGVWGSGPGEVR